METMLLNNNIKTETLVQDKFKEGMTYGAFKRLSEKLTSQGMTTGPEQSESLINYTELNDRRMKRWDKTLRFPENEVEKIMSVNRKINWLVLTESWCGDAAPTIPVMNKISEINPNIDLRIILRDEHLDLMDQFLTQNARSIPKLISFDAQSGKVLGTWGPRPGTAMKMAKDFREKNGSLTAEFKEELQRWYNADKGQDTLEDLLELLALK